MFTAILLTIAKGGNSPNVYQPGTCSHPPTERGIQARCLSWWLHIQEMAPNPWERHSWIVKMARDLVLKKIYIYLKGVEGELITSFLKKSRGGGVSFCYWVRENSFFFSICIYPYDQHSFPPSTLWNCTRLAQRLTWLRSFRGRSGTKSRNGRLIWRKQTGQSGQGRDGENQPHPGMPETYLPWVPALSTSAVFYNNCLLSGHRFW